jgi:hypothetical protein
MAAIQRPLSREEAGITREAIPPGAAKLLAALVSEERAPQGLPSRGGSARDRARREVVCVSRGRNYRTRSELVAEIERRFAAMNEEQDCVGSTPRSAAASRRLKPASW